MRGWRRAESPARRGGRGRSSEVRQHVAPEQLDLLVPLVAPELEHHVRTPRVAVLLDRGDAVGRRPRDGLALVENRVAYLGLGGKPSSLLHRFGNGADLV